MLEWIMLHGATLLISLVIAAALAAAVIKIYRDKKNGKACGGCDCGGCDRNNKCK